MYMLTLDGRMPGEQREEESYSGGKKRQLHRIIGRLCNSSMFDVFDDAPAAELHFYCQLEPFTDCGLHFTPPLTRLNCPCDS